jgi:3-deoxy-D-manno-octulosonate 8-phosphate phosphatase (KDO 8-P phosphatase)
MEDTIYGGLSVSRLQNRIIPTNFVLDLDGVFTDGKFYYTKRGKVMKVFGADDHDCLKMLGKFLKIQVVTADSSGFKISKRRIFHDMGMDIDLVDAAERLDWMSERFNLRKTIYMGDGVLDDLIFKQVLFSIAPSNALETTKKSAHYVTKNCGGDRAVAEACLHILDKFFNPRK